MTIGIPMAMAAAERNPDAANEDDAKTPSAATLSGLDWLNFHKITPTVISM